MKITILMKTAFVLLLMSCTVKELHSLPMYERTMLPFPNRIDESDKFMVPEIIGLSVYKDSKDRNLYYYVPPMHIRQYRQGAAGMMLNSVSIRTFADVKKAVDDRTIYSAEYSQQRLAELQTRVTVNEEKVETALSNLEEAVASGNEEIIAIRRQMLERRREIYDQSVQDLLEAENTLERVGTLLPRALSKAYNERIMMKLAAGGYDVPYDQTQDPEEVFANLKTHIKTFADSYGGYISFNAYGGFTKAQLDALSSYKSKYMPHIKVALLPVDKLTFVPLTEAKQYNASPRDSASFFRKVTGSGDYLGASIIMDTTLIGSLGLVEHLSPFVPPIGIKVTFKQQLEPTEAELSCDFTRGYLVYGRADVRDGLIIFDNDVTMKMNAEDMSRGGCSLKHISGDPSSAEHKALIELQNKLEAAHLRQTDLSNREKQAYFQGVINDIHNNRRDSRGVVKTVSQIVTSTGFTYATVVQLASRALDFHWHTNIQNVRNFTSLKFTKKISVHGYEKIEKDLPLNLCLVYNPDVHTYDRCSEMDESLAHGMQTAMHDAEASSSCEGISDPVECGKLRDVDGIPRNGRGSSLLDHNLSEEI